MKTLTFDETKWRLVPIVPTEEMIAAGWSVEKQLTPHAAYLAMIDSAPKYEEPDWVEWHGGECPVDARTRIEVKLLSEKQYEGLACYWLWDHNIGKDNIVAYRVVK